MPPEEGPGAGATIRLAGLQGVAAVRAERGKVVPDSSNEQTPKDNDRPG